MKMSRAGNYSLFKKRVIWSFRVWANERRGGDERRDTGRQGHAGTQGRRDTGIQGYRDTGTYKDSLNSVTLDSTTRLRYARLPDFTTKLSEVSRNT